MTQADSVHSTPRKTASKINLPVDPTRRHLLTVASRRRCRCCHPRRRPDGPARGRSGLKSRRVQATLASHAVAGIDRQHDSPQIPDSPAAFLESFRGIPFHRRLAARQLIIKRIGLLVWQTVRYVAHDLHDLSNEITACVVRHSAKQILRSRADLRLSVIRARKIPIVLI
jgi:hypothetical protein